MHTNETTLKQLAERVEVLEKKLAQHLAQHPEQTEREISEVVTRTLKAKLARFQDGHHLKFESGAWRPVEKSKTPVAGYASAHIGETTGETHSDNSS